MAPFTTSARLLLIVVVVLAITVRGSPIEDVGADIDINDISAFEANSDVEADVEAGTDVGTDTDIETWDSAAHGRHLLNCHGSTLCRHTGYVLDDIINFVEPLDNTTVYHNGEKIACHVQTYHTVLRKTSIRYICAWMSNLRDLPMADPQYYRAGGSTRGSIDGATVKQMLRDLREFGNCDACGSIPVGWKRGIWEWDDRNGSLVVNYVNKPHCYRHKGSMDTGGLCTH